MASSESGSAPVATAKIVLVALLTTVFALFVMAWPGALQSPSRFNLLPVGILFAGIITAVALVSVSSRRDRLPTVVGVIGVFLVFLGSGVMKNGTIVATHPLTSPDPLLRSYTVQTLNTNMVLIITGAVIALGAATWAALINRARPSPVALACHLAVLMTGGLLATIAFAIGNFTVQPVDFTGRPVRRRDGSGGVRFAGAEAAGHSRWVRAARHEAESVVAFLDLESRLKSVGAPDALQSRSRQAAADEMRHARLCCVLARRSGDDVPDTVTPEALPLDCPERLRGLRERAEITRLALESYVDGMLGEGASAAALDAEGRASEDQVTRRLLLWIARDEYQHADLGRDIVQWCSQAMPVSVPLALRVARWHRAALVRRASWSREAGTREGAAGAYDAGRPDGRDDR